MADDTTRDRVRALVKEVLSKTPVEAETPRSKFIDTVPQNPVETQITKDESAKNVITEDDLRDLSPGSVLRIGENARLTPLAADLVKQNKIELVRKTPRRGSKSIRLVAIGADHGGFKMKQELATLLRELGHTVHDFGTDSEAPVDYPDFAHAVARSVADKTSDVGIIIDGAGVGSAMTANKVPGVRAAAADGRPEKRRDERCAVV